MAKKILIITPRFPLPAAGACEQERLSGIKQLRRLGFDVRVIAKIFDFQDRADIDRFSRDHGIPVDLMPYDSSVRQGLAGALLFYLRRIMNPFHWDGAAYEYAHRETRRVVERITDTWKPDIAWFDYTYLWPLYPIFRQRKIPIVTRSINFEPTHFLQEDGCTPINIVKFFQKLLSEWIVRYKSAIIFAITPREAAAYQRLGARTVKNLPLRSLSVCLTGAEHPVRTGGSLNIFFAGSTYTVFHNRQTLDFILREIIPVLEQRKPGKFVFHFTGKKLPNDLRSCLSDRVIYHGFV
ncbi:MAG: hypothetical protein HYT22_04215, partial [Candidatus Niyogibacteria bacterium]|nr:hypothetical protein [Candidatus Niyogibacteria bacterium]